MVKNVISADSHVTEPEDLWVKYIEPKFRSRAPHVEHGETTDRYVCEGAREFPVGIIHGARFKGGNIKTEGRYSDIPASGWDPHARIVEQDVDGVVGEVIYPTIGMALFPMADVALQKACFRAYNAWLADFCKPFPQRLKGIAAITMDDVEWAVGELHRSKQSGLAGAMIPAFPSEALPYSHPSYEPFWAAAEALDVPISLHQETERRTRANVVPAPEEFILLNVTVQRTLVGMIYGGLFDRYPRLKVVSAENDAGWAGNIIERMDFTHQKFRMRNLVLQGANNKRVPSEYFRDSIKMTFMRDLSAMATIHVIGANTLMWGSDFPHLFSTWPDSRQAIAENEKGLSPQVAQQIFSDNAAKLYGF